ncbi:MAG: ComF family protein [Clostridium sp.]
MGEKIKRFINHIILSIGEFLYPNDDDCVICGEEYVGGLCIFCKNKIKKCSDGESYAYYIDTVKELITKFKFHNDFQCGEILATMMAKEYNFNGIEDYIVTSVPLFKKTYKKRGFNQSEYIAKRFADFKSLQYERTLIKIKETRPQKELSRQERKVNLIGAFEKNKFDVKNKKILLIDDVKTTGSTISEAKKILILSGAKEVRVLTVSKSDI